MLVPAQWPRTPAVQRVVNRVRSHPLSTRPPSPVLVLRRARRVASAVELETRRTARAAPAVNPIVPAAGELNQSVLRQVRVQSAGLFSVQDTQLGQQVVRDGVVVHRRVLR